MLTIDYGDGVQKRFTKIPWKGGMTILDAMQAAERHKRGIKYVVHGTGPTTLLTRIDDLKNEGGSGLNWIFRVNKKLGDSSFAVVKLKPGDDILWKFDEYR